MYNDFNFVHWIYGMQEFNTFLHSIPENTELYLSKKLYCRIYRILMRDILLSKWWYLKLTSQILIVLLNTKKWDLDHLDWDQYLYFKIIYNILCMQWSGWSVEIIFVLVPAYLCRIHIYIFIYLYIYVWRWREVAVLVVVMPVLFTGGSLTPRSVQQPPHWRVESVSSAAILVTFLQRRKYTVRQWYCTVWLTTATFFWNKITPGQPVEVNRNMMLF